MSPRATHWAYGAPSRSLRMPASRDSLSTSSGSQYIERSYRRSSPGRMTSICAAVRSIVSEASKPHTP